MNNFFSKYLSIKSKKEFFEKLKWDWIDLDGVCLLRVVEHTEENPIDSRRMWENQNELMAYAESIEDELDHITKMFPACELIDFIFLYSNWPNDDHPAIWVRGEIETVFRYSTFRYGTFEWFALFEQTKVWSPRNFLVRIWHFAKSPARIGSILVKGWPFRQESEEY